MSAPLIEAAGLTRVFQVSQKEPGLAGTVRHLLRRKTKEVRAVDDVSFTVQRGEFVGFLGKNGAGKTTTLKMLSGLLLPSSGTCRVAGHTPFDRQKAFLKSITLVMGNKQQLLWDLPAADTLRLNAAIYGVPDDVAKARLKDLSEMLEVADKLSQPVRKLSLGERMKCELLAALLHDPQVLFLDEPTLGLDVNAQVAVRNFLKAYNERTGATVLLTSHYMQDISALCERVLVIHDGHLVHDGGLDALLHQHAPGKEVKLELQTAHDAAALTAYGEVLEVDGNIARLRVSTADMTARVAQMLRELPIVDLSVQDPSLEDVIGRIFQSGSSDTNSDSKKTEAAA